MSEKQANEASQYLIALAKRNAQAYAALPNTRAIIVAGSAAEGISDFYSDLDMIVYYDELPSEEALQMACQQNEGEERRLFGERNEGAFFEAYKVRGVECQVVQTTIAVWEQEIAQVLEQLDVTSPLQKALSGMLEALPLHGEALVQQWQSRIASYPNALAEAMVKHYLAFFPVWGMQEHFTTRDATWWLHQILIEAEEHILGILAGLNRQYFSSFQFKRLHRFIQHMPVAPENLAARLDALLCADAATAASQIRELVQETMALVDQHMPQINTTPVRKLLDYQQQAWRPIT
ncbi:MAG TPA: hypothetical protein VKR83_21380 [Ktedonobacteraceae bacterium]|nr:hypothetical protein [Ktedonobacteraceae bacterium]